MGFLNNTSVTVDAILTKKGRELLARGQNEFQITQLALADDEVDYDLYNTEHPLGTAYYGASIENMPIVEALAAKCPVITTGSTSIPEIIKHASPGEFKIITGYNPAEALNAF